MKRTNGTALTAQRWVRPWVAAAYTLTQRVQEWRVHVSVKTGSNSFWITEYCMQISIACRPHLSAEYSPRSTVPKLKAFDSFEVLKSGVKSPLKGHSLLHQIEVTKTPRLHLLRQWDLHYCCTKLGETERVHT